MMVKEIYNGVQLDEDLIFTTSAKTQYACPDAHIAIIKLFRHVAAKYLEDFTLSDEGYFWEMGDGKILGIHLQKKLRYRKQKTLSELTERVQINMAATYSPTLLCSTIGHEGLNFSVRYGKR